MTSLKSTFLIVLLAAFVPFVSMGQPHSTEVSRLGSVDVRTSCTSEAEAHLETGLALLHHMMYQQAAEAFTAAATSDSTCAMGHWGIAMTQLHPLWAPPSDEEFQKGREALQNAQALQEAGPDVLTEREREYISAITAYFGTETASHRERLAAWEQALRRLHETDPGDTDASALYALAHLATAPPTDKDFAHQRRAGALLETLRTRAPNHPGLIHYLIHAYDNPVLAEKAVDAARDYDKIAPNVPHALHMPSHIYVRLGMWPEVVSWNARSAEAALAQPANGKTSMHHAHAMDYMMFAYLQQGLDQKAREVVDQITAIGNYQAHFGSAYGIAAAQARYPLERGAWAEAAGLPVRTHSDFPWANYPHYEALTYFARGLGAARSGNLAAARRALDTLDVLHERTVEAGEDYWAVQVDVQRKTVAAWSAYADDSREEAASLMREAADLEDSVDKHPVTPGAVRPARELLGDMLVLIGRPDEAIEAYRASLAISPNRFNSVYGLGHAAEQAGKSEVAKEAYEKLVAFASGTGPDQREHVARAKAFLAEN